MADLVFYHRYLQGMEKANKYCDINHDGTEDVFDLIALRRILTERLATST